MSPEQKAQVRQRLQMWDNLTPQQRMLWRQREQILESMAPADRQYVEQQVIPRWLAMPLSRQQMIRQRLRQLDGLSDSERQSKLNDESFSQGLTPEERRMLPYLSRLRVGSPPETSKGPNEF